jgi:short-subunit dehydrogenase
MSSTVVFDTALITDASTAIGATYADRMAGRGHDLVLVARDRTPLESLAERLRREHRVKVEVLAADLASPAERARVEQRLRDDDAIGWLINHACRSGDGSVATTPLDTVETMLQRDVVAPSRLTSAALPRLLARGRGSIIHVASALALAPEQSLGIYAASNSYLLTHALSLLREVGDSGVRVQAVLAGTTRTDTREHAGNDPSIIPAHKVMEVAELVDAALAGYDLGETVTIPSLPDIEDWNRYNATRLLLAPDLSHNVAADRYKSDIPEDA